VDSRRAGDVEDRDAVCRAAGRAVPRSEAHACAVAADPAPDGLKEVAARIGIDYADEEYGVRVPADASVTVRCPAASPCAAVPADNAVDRIRSQCPGTRGCRDFDADGRPGISASPPGCRRGTSAAGTAGSAGEVGDGVPLDRDVRGGRGDNPRRGAAVATPTARRGRVRLPVSATAAGDSVNRVR